LSDGKLVEAVERVPRRKRCKEECVHQERTWIAKKKINQYNDGKLGKRGKEGRVMARENSKFERESSGSKRERG